MEIQIQLHHGINLRKTHTYTTSGIYNLTITGTLDGWRFNNGGDRKNY